jgi:hypothetical protein
VRGVAGAIRRRVADRSVEFVDAGLEAKGVVGVTALNFNLAKLKGRVFDLIFYLN